MAHLVVETGISIEAGKTTTRIEITKELQLFFSYKQLIGIEYKGQRYLINNYWSTTTGKHINLVKDESHIQLAEPQFKQMVNSILKELFT